MSVNAQVNTYTFAQTSGTYTEIAGDTVVASATSTGTNPTDLDDAVYTTNSIPFTFTFNGTNYTNVVINSNGYISFGTTPSSATVYTPISTATAFDGASTAFALDQIGVFGFRCNRTISSPTLTGVSNFAGVVAGRVISGTGITAGTTIVSFDIGAKTITMSANATSSSTAGAANATIQVAAGSIVRGTTGLAGSRIHTIQWKNFRRFTTTDTLENLNYQIKLYEGSNKIEVVYGAMVKSPTTATITPQVGLRGLTTADFNNRTTTTNWAATTAGGVNTATCTMSVTVFAASGQTYTWTPPAPPVANDVGVTSAVIGTSNIQIISVGKGYDLKATVKNFGTATQNVIPVYYDVNGGAAVGPVNTVGPIVQNGTEIVSFTGGNAFIPAVAGTNVVRIWTLLGSDQHPVGNDTLTVNINAQQKIASYPYLQTFGAPTNWTIVIENNVGTTAIFGLGLCTNPGGVVNDTAITANFFNASNLRREILRSPEMDFTGVSNPVLDFYAAYRTYTGGENDTIQVLVSTDGGVNFVAATTAYDKSNTSSPSLATLPPSGTSFSPAAATEWRHETVSLANVANTGNVVIGFRGKSNFGNRAWIDNVIVSNVDGFCTSAVTGTGSYSCNPLVTLNFTAIPAPHFNGAVDNISSGTKNLSKEENTLGNISAVTGDVKVITSKTQNDNPAGGTAFISQYTANNPGQTVSLNATATTQNGSIFTPTFVYHDYWFTTTYDGNDLTGYATYDIKIDMDGLVFTDPTTLYIVKRCDKTGSWVCLSTTVSGNALVATGLTDFSDFAIAGDEALPVELASFVSLVNGRNVTLNWSTVTETNNAGFDIERSSNGEWTTVGNVAGNGTSAEAHNYSFTDRNLSAGTYSYRLKQTDINGNFEYFTLNNEVNIGTPNSFNLSQNYPNPFNPSTKINFDLPYDSKVSLKIFDMSGKEVATLVNEVKTAGYYSINFNAASLSSGIYFYSISAGNFTATKKMMLIK
jgi:hypothetical protein